uniref:Uncharacterized protein n=1 Tax=Oryza sativa subsp. japonica TaxID=39947 RepID=Q6YTE0_ORYSJ|nr:hypothetical protein [Oryza sativa Japonica Group]BAD17797.1 hypothetical protein [Oryza sativa Japonica Group]
MAAVRGEGGEGGEMEGMGVGWKREWPSFIRARGRGGWPNGDATGGSAGGDGDGRAVMATGGRRGAGLGAARHGVRRDDDGDATGERRVSSAGLEAATRWASGAQGERRDGGTGLEATAARAARQRDGDGDGVAAAASGSERRWDATATVRGGTGRETKGARSEVAQRSSGVAAVVATARGNAMAMARRRQRGARGVAGRAAEEGCYTIPQLTEVDLQES